MYKVARRIRISLVAIAITFAVLVPPLLQNLPGVNVAYAEDTQNLKLVLDTVDSAQGREKKLEYWSGETISVYPNFHASGTGVNIPNAKLELCVPRASYLEEPGYVDSSQAQGSARRTTDDAWCIDYTFDKITGGLKTAVPFSFRFKNEVTRTGFTVTPTWKLIGEDGEVIKEDSVTFTAKALDQYEPRKIASTTSTYSWDIRRENPRGVFFSQADFRYTRDQDDTHTPADWNRDLRYDMCVKPTGTGAPPGLGLLKPTKVKFVDKLPAEATLSPNSPWWKYDPETHSATFEGPVNYHALCGGYMATIYLRFNNATVYTDATKTEQLKHVNKMVATVDPGLATEHELPEVSDSVVFRPVLYTPPPPPPPVLAEGQSNLAKWVHTPDFIYYAEKLYRRGEQVTVDPSDPEKDIIRWVFNISNTNNKRADTNATPISGTGIKSYFREVRDYGLDSRLYYNTFKINDQTGFVFNGNSLTRDQAIAQFNAMGNVLYGVKDDNIEVELARDLKIGQSVNIDDKQRQYKALRLAFATPLEMDNQAYGFVVTAYPVATEMEKWKAEGYQGRQSYINDADAQASLGSVNSDVVRVAEKPQDRANNYVYIDGITPRVAMFSGFESNRNRISRPPDSNTDSNAWIVYENCENKRDSSGENLTVATITPQNCGRVRNFHVNSSVSGIWGTLEEPVKNLRQIVVLPPGVNYLRTTGSSMYGRPLPKPIEPTIVPNFKNTGRTALVYNYGDVESRYGNGDWRSLGVQSSFDLDTTLYAEMNPRPNIITYYTLWDNNDLVKPEGNTWNAWPITDTNDIDEDGNTTERFMASTMNIRFTPPAELVPKKSVSLDGHGWSLSAPAQDLGGSVFYRYSV
ncbi:hypothetical protein, partial [Schaalia sp. lx-100]|uniref:hypothetical protein n=1 Tax=Schaalia sp. lx-100 TaxID=2899081 RepID=UPI001E4B0DED